jgi:SAM-dependent methyltransferase
MPAFPPLALNAWLRYDLIRRALADVPPGAAVLEIGAGQGAVGARLARRYHYTGLEPDPASARIARRRIEAEGGRLLEVTSDALHGGELFRVVCAFEVLEHLEDDAEAVRSWVRHLAPGGMLLLSVPAFPSRFSAWDVAAGHFRRYDPDLLCELLTKASLAEIQVWVMGFPFGVVLESGRNLVATLRPKTGTMAARTLASGRLLQPPAALGWATQAVTWPFRWLQRPFIHSRLGTGLVARATKPR